MTQEDKQLLLKDLCARLPYGVMLNIDYYDLQGDGKLKNRDVILSYGNISYCSDNTNWVSVKPYLRPISSMTEEEKIELKEISNDYLDEWENTKTSLERWKLDAKESYKRTVFYNLYHFDWNDLISKGLAIEVTEDNNPYKE